jgi:hypothetical protein
MNQQANAILERIHGVLRNMLRTSELDMAKLVNASYIDVFLSDTAWGVCSTYHSVLNVGVYGVWSGLCDLRTDHTLPRY